MNPTAKTSSDPGIFRAPEKVLPNAGKQRKKKTQ